MHLYTRYEEMFLNCKPTVYRDFLDGFILNYGGNDMFSNCVHSIYSDKKGDLNTSIKKIEHKLEKDQYHSIYRIINHNSYQKLDSLLFKKNYDKFMPETVLGCDLRDKKEQLFPFASFYENGVFIDKNIKANDDRWVDDYFYLCQFDSKTKDSFRTTLSLLRGGSLGFTLVSDGMLVGQAFAVILGSTMVLDNIIISSKYRSLGYGTKLLMSILTYAIKCGCIALITRIPSENEVVDKVFSEKYFSRLYSSYYRGIL